jgi:hypothetical protein
MLSRVAVPFSAIASTHRIVPFVTGDGVCQALI